MPSISYNCGMTLFSSPHDAPDELIIQRDISLKPFNTFGLDATAQYFVSIVDERQFDQLFYHPLFNSEPHLVLGGGSNIVLTRDFAGMVVHIAHQGINVLDEDETHVLVAAAAGEVWHDFVRTCLERGWYGLENLALIPGTVGAAPIQNIGAYGVEVESTFDCLIAFDTATGCYVHLTHEQCHFGYRDSIFKREAHDRYVILEVAFKLSKIPNIKTTYADVERELTEQKISQPTPKDVFNAVCAVRQRKLPDPTVMGNAGSFFKNPVVSYEQYREIGTLHPGIVHYPQKDGTVKLAAAWMIDRCGWKGQSLGQAGVHANQALVLVNRGDARGEEVLALANAIMTSVKNRFGVLLTPEPEIL